MYLIDLTSIPNQTFSINLDGVNYRIALRTIQEMTYMSVWANGEILFYNQLCVPNAYVNPYNYVGVNGKFFFKCINNDYPNYQLFGNTQSLYFVPSEEVSNA